ncbi:MAG: rRNA adenine N-6-methyltransferase family protein [Anaerolineae bacterium]
MVPVDRDDLESIIRRLEDRSEAAGRHASRSMPRFAESHDLRDWEGRFSPQGSRIYDSVLAQIHPDDVVLDIGAGDLRLALRMAGRARRVYAVEVNPLIVSHALRIIGLDLPRNLYVICANALDFSFPSDVTVAVLLMRHCQHVQEYIRSLRGAGCGRLLTNARWKTGVESIDLAAPDLAFDDLHEGWYACRCGATGYVGTGEKPDAVPIEVASCPACSEERSCAG